MMNKKFLQIISITCFTFANASAWADAAVVDQSGGNCHWPSGSWSEACGKQFLKYNEGTEQCSVEAYCCWRRNPCDISYWSTIHWGRSEAAPNLDVHNGKLRLFGPQPTNPAVVHSKSIR